MDKQAFVYILASQKNGTLYTGVTSNLMQRILQHKTKAHPHSFTAKYTVNNLVWYVAGNDITSAIELEKKIKNRNRAWKIALIEKDNPEWNDLSLDFLDSATDARNDNVVVVRHTEEGRHGHAAHSCSIQNSQGIDSATDARNDEVVV